MSSYWSIPIPLDGAQPHLTIDQCFQFLVCSLKAFLHIMLQENLVEKRAKERKQKLTRIVEVNSRHAQAQPVYGVDLVKAVSVVHNVWTTVKRSEYLTSMIKTPEYRIDEMREIIRR